MEKNTSKSIFHRIFTVIEFTAVFAMAVLLVVSGIFF